MKVLKTHGKHLTDLFYKIVNEIASSGNNALARFVSGLIGTNKSFGNSHLASEFFRLTQTNGLGPVGFLPISENIDICCGEEQEENLM